MLKNDCEAKNNERHSEVLASLMILSFEFNFREACAKDKPQKQLSGTQESYHS